MSNHRPTTSAPCRINPSQRAFIVAALMAVALGAVALSSKIVVAGGPETARSKLAGQSGKPITGVRGSADKSSIIRFTDLAQQQPPKLALQEIPEPDAELSEKFLPSDAFIQRESAGAVSALPSLATPSPAPAASFQALADDNTYIPPDTQGAVGPNHLMVTLNSQVRIQTRSGGTISTTSLGNFWSSLGYSGLFDPRVLYDPYTDRWIFISLAGFRSASSALLVSVSQTSDPAGAWRLYGADIDSTDQTFIDYPTMGFNKDWIVVSVNRYRISDKGFVSSNLYVFSKANLYAGGAGSFTLLQDATGHSMAPAVTYDNSVSTMYVIEDWNGNLSGSGYLRLSTITGAVGSEVLNSGGAFSATANPWDDEPPGDGNFAPQFGSAQKINNGDAVIQNVVYRNGSLWCAHTIFLPAGAPTRSAIQWWQITPAGAIQQRGRIDDATGNLFYGFPSIAVNQNNDALIGYSRFSASQYASANYAVRAATDPPGTLRDEVVLKSGEAPYFKTSGSARNKWGDFGSTVIDPVNNVDMWTIQEYAAAPVAGSDRWGTWWGRINPNGSPSASGDIVIYASEAPVRVGNWSVVADATAAGGARLFNPDQGVAKIIDPLANPAHYFEMTFNAQANTAYRLWIRGRAQNDYWGNDSVFAQFSDSLNSSNGTAVFRIGTTDATPINLEDCSGCGLQGWGWQDNGWGVGVMGPLIYFANSGSHTIRIQVREDGLSIDQIVLSPTTYLNAAPGPLKNDTTILPKQGGTTPPPTISSIAPNTGGTAGGTQVTISGTNFLSGASVSIGGTAATSVNVTSSTQIAALTPAHAAGTVNVTVTNPDGQSGTLTNAFTYAATTPMPPFGHVFVVVEENHSYANVIGSFAMPYLNNLANQYGLATNFYANTHPSIGNYFMLTTGQIITNDDNFAGTVSADNIVRQLTLAGKTWKAYAESLPSVGYTGGDVYPYSKHHNPFAYFSDVLNSPAQANRMAPFSQLATDMANNQVPNYSFIIPNQQHNAHDCPAGMPACSDADKLAALDAWLSANIQPLISSPMFQQDGLLIITFDESVNADTANGGGQIATLVISAKAKPGYRSTSFYQQQSTLRTMAEALGLSSFPGAAATAPNMAEFIETAAPTVSAISPTSGSTNGGTAVTITGNHFPAGVTVTLGGATATNVNVINSTTITATTPAHAAGAVSVVVTNANGQSGTLASGFTYTASPPPPSNIVMYATDAPVRVGSWNIVSDATAAGGARLFNPDAGAAKLIDPLANPAHYFEMTFNAQANTAYRLWIRGRAQNDYWGNDSVFAQFSDSLNSSGGAAVFRIGTTDATPINLEDCSGCGLQGWGWQDNGWGVGVMGPLIYFANSGPHTIRIQVREDGLSIDQIVLSPTTYLNAAPGPLKNDNTILPKTQ